MNDKDKAAQWLPVLANVSGRDLAWHLGGILKADGERVLNEVLRALEIKSVVDLVKRAA